MNPCFKTLKLDREIQIASCSEGLEDLVTLGPQSRVPVIESRMPPADGHVHIPVTPASTPCARDVWCAVSLPASLLCYLLGSCESVI